MTTTTARRASTAGTPAASPAGTRGVTFGGILKSEWIKLWTLLSTKLLLAATLVAIVGVGALTVLLRYMIMDQMAQMAADSGQTLTPDQLEESFPPGSQMDLYNLPNSGLQIGILVLGSLAVLFIASEYATGMIRSTMSAVPRRIPAFAAKAVILAVVSYVLTTIAAAATFLIAMPVFRGRGIDLDWDREGVLSGLFTGGLYVAGVALIGLSLGVLLRNSAGAITVLVGIFFVLPFASQFLALAPGEFWKYVPQYLPADAGGRFLSIGHMDGVIDPWHGGLLFLGYVLLFLVPALIVIKRRDV
ncbi:ABC transporter permease subunit [Pseudarthrobacter sp. J75]|uniref:ABC transporter permease subunit n=1 Tax=unclassified Pseudarthrobacter TaxID=2647000 RepID=UPI002E81DDD3|nr:MULTISPECIES: ABC transporter permease subunit [unclassified Pseudarthrobacter]MEE2524434.1 ABC transporter permease subunit [Pseudarthrobacter sp. J47]MEE2529865.1 ABC transporter permease subunit [Pseudarthrobacter sp. J75]